MKRVVITGYGIVSSLGNNKAEVTQSLKEGRSGIVRCEEYADLGMRSHVHGSIDIDAKSLIDLLRPRCCLRGVGPCRLIQVSRPCSRQW